MSFERSSLRWLFLVFAAPLFLPAQTTVNINNTTIQSPVKRFGINLGTPNFYDSGQMTKNLVFTTNPSFEGEIYQSLIQCGSGTANSCADVNLYAGFTNGFWNNASYTMITGTSAGRSGSICSFSPPVYPQNGGVYTFCDSGTAPAYGDYMLVRTTMPADVGWPIGGDWLTTVGGGTFTAETTDLPPGTVGKQSGLLTAPTGSDSVSVNMFFDSTPTQSFVQLNGSYVLTFKAKGVAGNQNVAVSLTRGTNTFFTQTQPLTGAWQTYTIPFTGTENGSALTKVKLSFTAAGPDTIELDDVSLTKSGTDPTNTTIFRDEVVQALQAVKPGVLRYWVDQLGDSLDNLLAAQTGRQRSGYTPYAGFDGTNITLVGGVPTIGTFQTQSVKVGLPDFLQLCQKVGADPWIVVPSTFTQGEAYSLMDYLAGGSSSTYGALRIAQGQTATWTSVFNVIHLEFGNEEWNGGTFKGGALETGSLSYSPYGVRAQSIFQSIKGNPGYSQSHFDLIINGQSASPYSNYFTQLSINNNDSFSIAPYMMYNINEWATTDHLFGTTFAEAEAFVTPSASAEGVTGGYIIAEQNGTHKPIVTSEMNLSPTGTPSSSGDGPLTQAAMNGYASSVGGGIAVLDSMFQQLRAGVLTQNLFALPGWDVQTQTGTTAYLWGAVVDMGVTNRKRPQYLALQLANNAIGSNTQMLQTQHTGLDPTDTQYNYGLNSVTLPTFHFLQSFAFTDGAGNYSLVVFNVSPDYPEVINFGGAIQPTGTVNVQQLTSANITDTNEASNVVNIQSIAFASSMTLPPYSMTTFTWGGGTQTGPTISSVTASGITANSATITWTTNQASSSQVNYGLSSVYTSQTALNSTLVTTHSVTLTGLTPGTTYHFDVVSANSSNASSTSPDATFVTPTAAPVLSSVQATSITSTSAAITWTTDQASSSTVSYGLSSSYGSTATGASGTTTHSVTLTGLTPNTTYYYQASSTNGTTQTGTSANLSFTTSAAASPVISNVVVGSITQTSAIVTWTTDQSSTSVVSYGTTASYGSTASTAGNVLSHSVTLTGLVAGTTYHIQVTSVNSSNGSSSSPDQTFATNPANPVVSAIATSAITQTSATITWTTDQSSSSVVNYGTSISYGSTTTGAGGTTSHSVSLTGLTAGTTYHFTVTSVNATGGTTTSGDQTFTTNAANPVISAIATSAITQTSATITWTTDQSSTSVVNYGNSISYGSTTTGAGGTTSHSVSLTGLTAGTTYHFTVTSVNATGGTTTSGDQTFTTTAGNPVLSLITATSLTSNSAVITWTTDQSASSLVNYGLTTSYGTPATGAANVTAHSVSLTGLQPSTTYHFTVTSVNSTGGTSVSGDQTFTTTAASAPVISALTVSSITTTSAVVTWTTDQNSNSFVNYGTTASFGSQATTAGSSTTHSVTLTGLTPGTTYTFDVTSTNSSGVTATSGNSTFTTVFGTPVLSAVTATSITSTSVTITWTTDQQTTSQVAYGATTSYGSSTPLNSSLVTAHSVSITGLTPNTTYDYQAISANSANATGKSANFTFTTSAAPAPVISNVAVSGITTTSATVTWTTDQSSSSLVNFGATTAYGSQATGATGVTSHTVTLSGLTPGTTYNFDVVSANISNVSATSANSAFTTVSTGGGTGPVISSIATWPITDNTATILWVTDQPSSSQVKYGSTTAYGSQTQLDSSLNIYHVVQISGLNSGTTYHFSIVTADAGGTSTSADSTFTTTGTPPANPGPAISAVATSGVTSTSATITWTTDVPSSSQVSYGTSTSYGSQSPLDNTLVTSHTVTLTGLTTGTTYNFAVTSVTGTGGLSTSANFTFATTVVLGSGPVISRVAAWPVANTTATILWTTDQSSSSQVKFGTTAAYGSQTQLDNTGNIYHVVQITGLNPGTTYHFAAISTDSGGTTTSTDSSFTTTGTAPVNPGPVISAVTSTGISATSVTIQWNTDQPSTSQVSYGVTTSYGAQSPLSSALVTAHSVAISGLAPGTTYNFAVTSVNGSGGSSTSTNFSFSTNSSATPAPVISAVTASGVTTSSATITWTTDQASSSQVSYGTTTAYGSQSALDNTSVTSHSVTLTGLTSGTLYDFTVTSASSNGSTTSSNFTFTTTATAPVAPVITQVASSGLAPTSATITWTTDQPATSQVLYGPTTGYGLQSPANTALVTSHSVTLTGLTAGTLYDFAVVSANSSTQTTTSANFTFTTPAVAGPAISSVATWPVDNNTATILWVTDQNATSQVKYGTTNAYGQQSALNSTLGIYHAVPLSGLISGTTYHFSVVSTNSSNVTSTSPDATFTTTGVAPVVGPVISAVTTANITNTTATITWTTDAPSSSQASYGPTSALGYGTPVDTTLVTSHSLTLTGLTPGTVYYYAVTSTNSLGGVTTSGSFSFSTTGSVPAPVISAVVSYGITGSSAIIGWSTDQLADSQVLYGTTNALGQTTTLQSTLTVSHGATLTGLNNATTYYYQVRSANSAGSVALSPILSFTTANTAGPVISNVVANPLSGNAATILWTSSKPASIQIEYGRDTTYGWWTSPTTSSPTALGWTPSGTVHFRIHATDAQSNTTVTPDATFVEP